MLFTCDRFADNCSNVFNAKKSKCFKFEPTHNSGSFTTPKPDFYIGCNMIDIINQWPHLDHIIDNRFNDGAGILFRGNAMVFEINNVLCYFNQVGILCLN